MVLSVVLALALICGIFLLLFSAVALIQDKRFFSSAPGDAFALIQEHPERFRGQHLLGWILAVVAAATVLGAVAYGVYDGVRNGFDFWQFFLRFVIMLDGYKIWDMLFLDRYLLVRSGFFEHYYPEVAHAQGMQQAGFNNKQQLLKLLVVFPAVSAVASLVLSLVA